MAKIQSVDNSQLADNFAPLKIPRLLVVDLFRGLAVLGMLIYDYVPFFSYNEPRILQHGRTDFLLPGDFVAPFFLFTMGMSLAFTWTNRRSKGVPEREILKQVLYRAVMLIVIGLLVDETKAMLVGMNFGLRWGVLETLGVSYLITYLALRLNIFWRIAAITGLLTTHFLLSQLDSYVHILNTFAHGSPFGVLGWAVISIFGMIAGEHLVVGAVDYEWWLYKVGCSLVLLGVIVNTFEPFSKNEVSISYALLSSGVSVLVFMFLYGLIEVLHWKWLIRIMKPLRDFGIAALTVWILQYILAAPIIYDLYRHGARLPWEYGTIVAGGLIVITWTVVHFLNRRGLTLRI
ncbi:MAG: heparan-alpha-glucosaminide N-acetyltransferase domain-containing protein [Actinomycetota bacterium]